VEGSRAPPQGVPTGREYRTAGRNGPPLTLEGPGCYPPSCQQIGRAGWRRVPSRQRSGQADPRPARSWATIQPGQAGRRVGTLAGSVQEEKAGVVSMEAVAPLVALVALPISIALFGWLIYRLLRPGRRR
jgi:hypothetical protein